MITDFLTAALVVITAFYAWVTHRILRANENAVKAMKEQTLAISRPYISVVATLEPDNPIFYLKITNLGKSAAYNLKLTIDRSFYQINGNDLAKYTVFNDVIDSFAAESEITFAMERSFVIFNNSEESPKFPWKFSITAEYEFGGNKVCEINRIDLRPFLNADVPQNPYIRKLKDISDSLQKLEQGRKQKN